MDEPTESRPSRVCPWCSAEVPASASRCPSCGDALAQRESIDALVIPGVTAVDPTLEIYAAQPLRLPGPSPIQSMTGRAIVEAGIVAADLLGVGGDDVDLVDIRSLGQPSDAALRAVERLDREGPKASPDATSPDESPPGADMAPS
jgi:hypothetical protein